MSGHFLVILEKGEDWEIEHPDGCAQIKVYDADPFHPEAGPIMVHDCLVGRIVMTTGIDDEFEWKDLEPGKYEIDAWEHHSTNFHSMFGEYEAGLEFVDVDDRGSTP